MNSSDRVRAQYETDRNLTVRIRFQQTYSVNKQGFAAFIESHYDLEEGIRILELGCGNGSSWPELKKRLPDGCSVILSDFSAGMLDAAKARVGDHPQIAYQVTLAMWRGTRRAMHSGRRMDLHRQACAARERDIPLFSHSASSEYSE